MGDANILRPTPGGKYVFDLNTSTGLGEAVDFEDLSQAKQVSLSGQTPLEQFEFPPMEHDIFTQGPAGLEAWDHKAGELSSPETLPFPPAAGAPALNSRGTRIYLPRSGSLDYGLLAEHRLPSAAIGPAPSGKQEGVWLVLNARLHFYTTDGWQKAKIIAEGFAQVEQHCVLSFGGRF